MAVFKRSSKTGSSKGRKPQVVTGDFELHYEDIISRNRFMLVGVLTFGLVLIAALAPRTSFYSTADTDKILLEAEAGLIENRQKVLIINNEIGAGEGSYIEFK